MIKLSIEIPNDVFSTLLHLQFSTNKSAQEVISQAIQEMHYNLKNTDAKYKENTIKLLEELIKTTASMTPEQWEEYEKQNPLSQYVLHKYFKPDTSIESSRTPSWPSPQPQILSSIKNN